MLAQASSHARARRPAVAYDTGMDAGLRQHDPGLGEGIARPVNNRALLFG